MKSLDAMSLVTEVKLGRVPYNIPERWRYLAWWLNFRIGEGWSENAAAVCRGQPRLLSLAPSASIGLRIGRIEHNGSLE